MREVAIGTVKSPFSVINIQNRIPRTVDTKKIFVAGISLHSEWSKTTIDFDIVCNSCEISDRKNSAWFQESIYTLVNASEVFFPFCHYSRNFVKHIFAFSLSVTFAIISFL